MDNKEAGKIWAKLHEVWHIANQEALQVRHMVTKGFIECAAGRGPGPNAALLEKAEALQRVAEAAKLEEDNFLRSYFG